MERGAFEPIESPPRLETLDATLAQAPCQHSPSHSRVPTRPSRSRVPAQHALSRAMANPRTGASLLHSTHGRVAAPFHARARRRSISHTTVCLRERAKKKSPPIESVGSAKESV